MAMLAFIGRSLRSFLAVRPILTAPAVCELDGPTITGPIISYIFMLFLPGIFTGIKKAPEDFHIF
jgi:hypothetical protein